MAGSARVRSPRAGLAGLGRTVMGACRARPGRSARQLGGHWRPSRPDPDGGLLAGGRGRPGAARWCRHRGVGGVSPERARYFPPTACGCSTGRAGDQLRSPNASIAVDRSVTGKAASQARYRSATCVTEISGRLQTVRSRPFSALVWAPPVSVRCGQKRTIRFARVRSFYNRQDALNRRSLSQARGLSDTATSPVAAQRFGRLFAECLPISDVADRACRPTSSWLWAPQPGFELPAHPRIFPKGYSDRSKPASAP